MRKIILLLFLLFFCVLQAMGDDISDPGNFQTKFEDYTETLDITADISLSNTQPYWKSNGGSKTINGNGHSLSGSGDCGLKIQNNRGWISSAHQNLDIYNLSINNMKHSDGAVYLVLNSNNKNTTLNLENVSFDGNNRAINTNILNGRNIIIEASGGMSFTNNAFAENGGAVYLSDKSVANFKNGAMTFSGNQAAGRGGAIYSQGEDSSLSFTGSTVTFSGNMAEGGGAIELQSNAKLNISGSNILFENNVSSGNAGGAIHLLIGSAVDVNTSTIVFRNNRSEAYGDVPNGGALDLYQWSVFSATDSVLSFENNTSAGRGGAVYAGYNSILNFNNSSLTFSNNKAGETGGGAIHLHADAVTFKGSLIEAYGNEALNGGYGGFLYLEQQNISFENDTIRIASNTASAGGGIYSVNESSASFKRSDVRFEYNIANGTGIVKSGGAIYSDNSEYNFTSSTVSFLGNKSANGSGGAVYANNTKMTFTGSIVSFENNIIEDGSGSGGAISLSGNSILNFNSSDAVFTGNKLGGGWGGAISFSSSVINFIGGKNMAFYGNFAEAGRGGAVYAGYNASMNFSGNENIAFSGNKANFGGAVYASGASSISFSNISAVTFSNNDARASGGAVYASGASSISFSNISTVTFSNNNTEASGGAIYGEALSSISFSNINLLLFENNGSLYNGGALYLSSSAPGVDFSNTSVMAVGNSAQNGGFLYSYGATANFYGDSFFSGNNAGNNGGAVYAANNSNVLFTDAVFENNRASGRGGAVYVENSSVVFQTTAGKQTIFRGNSDSKGNNALYAGANSAVTFQTFAGGSVEMHDGISGSGQNASFIFRGPGDFNLYGNSLTNEADIINEGNFNLKNASNLKSGNFYNSSVLNMSDGFKNTVYVKNFSSSGSLYMDLFSSDDSSDRIISDGDIDLSSSTSVLNAVMDSPDNNFRKKTFRLINYKGEVRGTFKTVFVASITLSTSTNIPDNPKIYYGDLIDNWIAVTLYGKNIKTDFSGLKGLSFNQRQTAKVYDCLSEKVKENEDMDIVISLVESGNEVQQKNALSQASGYFLANVVRSGGAGCESNEIYEKLTNAGSLDGNINTGLWMRGKVNVLTNGADDNSLNDYTDTTVGAVAGYDIPFSGGIFLGAYGKLNKHNISQDHGNNADIVNAGMGVYGGYIKSGWEVKALLSGSFDGYDTERYISFMDRKAKASFSGMTVDADIEGALKMKPSDNTDLKYYAGMHIRNSGYEEIKESGAQSLNLTVSENAYRRVSARAGIAFSRQAGKFGWHLNGEYKLLFTGNLPEIESEFEGSEKIFNSRGAEEGRGAIGVKAGGSFIVTPYLKLFADTGFHAADKYQNIYGSLGLKWSISAFAVARVYEKEDRQAKKTAKERKKNAKAERKRFESAMKADEKAKREAAKAEERRLSENLKNVEKEMRAAEAKRIKAESKKIKEEEKKIDSEIKAYEKAFKKAEKERLKAEKTQIKQADAATAGEVKTDTAEMTKPEVLKTDAKILEYEIMLAVQQKKEEARLMAEKEKAAAEMKLRRERKVQEAASQRKKSGEISDEELADRKKEAENRMLKPIIESFEVRFMSGKYDLSPHWIIELGKQSESVKKYEYKKISIEGHADALEDTPKKLSRLRARAVYDELIRNGIPAEKMSYVGLSSVLPAASNKDEAGRMANRRVVIVIE